MQLSEVRGPRRVVGLGAAVLALAALLLALGFSVANLVFQFTTIEAVGEVVAIQPAQAGAGQAQPDRHAVVIEYADRNGQVRRFDEVVSGDAPRRGDELAVRYSARPPVEARIANYWWIWRDATIAGAIALGLGLCAEEALRVRTRTGVSRP